VDPEQALKNARDACERIVETEPGTVARDDAAADLAEAFDALDSWLSRGGFLPRDWARR
jgi:hypothetical protein